MSGPGSGDAFLKFEVDPQTLCSYMKPLRAAAGGFPQLLGPSSVCRLLLPKLILQCFATIPGLIERLLVAPDS